MGIDSLKTDPVRSTPNYPSNNNTTNSSINQQNITTIPVVTRDYILKQYLK